jgi:hypothetical protein
MTNAKTEAIEKADAELNNAGLPTYSDLIETLRKIQRYAVEDGFSDFQARIAMDSTARAKVEAAYAGERV